jgi:hypothetical protein
MNNFMYLKVLLKLVSVFSNHRDDPWGTRADTACRGHVPLFNFPCDYCMSSFLRTSIVRFSNAGTDVSAIQALFSVF